MCLLDVIFQLLTCKPVSCTGLRFSTAESLFPGKAMYSLVLRIRVWISLGGKDINLSCKDRFVNGDFIPEATNPNVHRRQANI